MGKPRISATVANVVVTATVNSRLDLERIVASVPGATVPQHFPAVIYRPPPDVSSSRREAAARKERKANPCLLIFSSGKMVCPGNRDKEEAEEFVKRFLKDLRRHGIEVHGEPAYRLSNVVASGSFGGLIDIEAAAQKLRHVVFEPEQFPGLIFRMDEPHAVFLLFTSGKFVCPGAPDERRIREAAARMRALLESEGLIAYADDK
jgi:transcription initiation factor TFIID TATA-box-binding protein